MSIVVAVDGPAASGKGTLARRLAAELGYAYLDTGLLYRAVGVEILRVAADPADEAIAANIARAFCISEMNFADPALRNETSGYVAAVVATHANVRAALVGLQREFARTPPGAAPGAVLDGRDIGTIICPGADYKFFVDAAIEVRAGRRAKELREKGDPSIYSRVLHDMKERDLRDRTRKIAPLAPAADASVIDTTNLSANAAFALAMSLIK